MTVDLSYFLVQFEKIKFPGRNSRKASSTEKADPVYKNETID